MISTIKPSWKQHTAFERLIDGTTKFLLFGGGAGGGKSYLGCMWILTNCYNYPGYKAFIGRSRLKDLMTTTFLTFSKVCKEMKIPRSDWGFNRQYSYIQFKNGSRIDFLDLAYQPSDPLYQHLGSLEYTDGWIEEAEEVPFAAFDVLKSRIGRWRNDEFKLLGKILMTANPSKGWLYQTFYWPWKGDTLPPQYAFVQSLYKDNPHTALAYGKQLSEIRDRATRERLMFGNWEYDDDPTALIGYDAILDLFTNTPLMRTPRYIAADIARYGKAKTVIGVWDGLDLTRVESLEKLSIDRTAEIVRSILVQERVPYSHCVVDEDGLGAGVADILRGVRGFVGNSSPTDVSGVKGAGIERPNFRNMKSQCSWLLAEAINDRKMAISAPISESVRQSIIQELEQIRSRDVGKDRSFQVRTKDEVMEALGRSPDYADMLMMRMIFQSAPPREAYSTPILSVPYGNTRFG